MKDNNVKIFMEYFFAILIFITPILIIVFYDFKNYYWFLLYFNYILLVGESKK